MGMSYFDPETTRRAADESTRNAGTVEQDEEWDRDDDEALSGSLFPFMDDHTLVGALCVLGIAILALGSAVAWVLDSVKP